MLYDLKSSVVTLFLVLARIQRAELGYDQPAILAYFTLYALFLADARRLGKIIPMSFGTWCARGCICWNV